MGKGKPGPTHYLNAPRRNCTCTNCAPDESVSSKPNTRPYSGPAKVLDANPSRSNYQSGPEHFGNSVTVRMTARDEENLRPLEADTPSDNRTIVFSPNHPHST